MKTRQRPQSREVALSVIRTLALATWVSTVALIVLGSAVRVTNSGMGCRGWPLCTGAQGSIASFHPLMEESHRLLASLVTILIVTLAWSVRRNARARQLRGPSTAAVAVIVVQIILGAVTVFAHNAPFTVALHLLTATLFLAVVSVVVVAAFLTPEESWSLRHGLGALAWAAVTALYVVVISGSVVVNAGAQSACASWPVCLHSPAPTSLLVVQMLHRSLVLVASVLVVAFAVSSLRAGRERRGERTLAKVALVLLGAQIAVGAMSAIWSTHSELADVHLALASLLWSSVVMLAAWRARDLDVTRAPSSARAVGSVRA